MRDVSRSSRHVGAGGDGRCGVSATQVTPTKTPAADGEVVWSWRRDPGATLAGDFPAGNGGKKGRSPGRSRISRKPLRGESRDVSAVPVKTVCILLYAQHTALRAQSAPGFPCALFGKRANEVAKLGQIMPRDRWFTFAC